MYICINIDVCICIYMYMFVCTYVLIFICVYIYVYLSGALPEDGALHERRAGRDPRSPRIRRTYIYICMYTNECIYIYKYI